MNCVSKAREVKVSLAQRAFNALFEKQSACDNHKVRFEVRGSNLRWRCTFLRFSPGSRRACSQSRSSVPTPPSVTIDIGLRLASAWVFTDTPVSNKKMDLVIPVRARADQIRPEARNEPAFHTQRVH